MVEASTGECAIDVVSGPVGHGGKRMGRVGIVALARKLLVALWRYVEQGVVPTGAQFKPGFTIEAAK